ncbi:MAG: Isopropylmalate/homocitrate/citramalate synthase [Rickettsiaceae bacterium]|jgi:2-isopropylmalate synthase|nr:Isopropylmalate/homocitrate/citramalate synthase [Rickettsiaceae bacterium]
MQSPKQPTTEKIIIFDTTLRDGEQAPGATMNLDEKLAVAKMLEKMRVDVIEAGFPIASEGDFLAVNQIAKIIKESVVCGLARAKDADIRKAAEAVKPAAMPRIHTFIATSPIHMQYKLKMDEGQVLEAITSSVSLAKSLCGDVDWSCEDGTRSELNFLYKAIETAIKAGANTINIPDTVGYTTPEEYFELITNIRNNVANIDKAIISTHCHNDLGLAVANSLSAIRAGARQIECTINGIGERAGNAALEEVVMAIKTRNDFYNFSTNIDTSLISRTSKLVSGATGFVVQPNKAIVGSNAFAHESGIHQDGMLKNRNTYEIMSPESVGIEKSSLVLGKHSGRAAFKDKLSSLGYELGHNALEDAFTKFKNLADHKKEITDEDIIVLMDDSVIDRKLKYQLLNLDVKSIADQSEAVLKISIDGKESETSAISNNGPVDVIFKAIKNLIPHEAVLELYQISAVTGGTDSQATAVVRLRNDNKTTTCKASNLNVLLASALAYINCLNKL